MERLPIDVHCHLFNKDIVTVRLLAELAQTIAEEFVDDDSHLSEDQMKLPSKSFKDRWTKAFMIINFLRIGLKRNSLKVYKQLRKTYKDDYLVCPLMFDLDYCFVSGSEDVDQGKKGAHQKIMKRLNQLRSHSEVIASNGNEYARETIRSHKRLAKMSKKVLKRGNRHPIFFWRKRRGFSDQLKEILAVQKKYPQLVFPFFVVDPRRKDVLDLVKKWVIRENKFIGIKLYCPNGYTPFDPLFVNQGGLFDLCIEHDLPITAHCSYKGFASFADQLFLQGKVYENEQVKDIDGVYQFHKEALEPGWVQERASLLNHPLLWEQLLKVERFKQLRLNLAHFGNAKEGYDWSESLFAMLQNPEYPNLYYDLSAYTERDRLQHVYDRYYKAAEAEVKSKFMYGSDFYLNMIDSKSQDDYLKLFKEVFGQEEFGKLSIEHTRKFLNLEGLN